MSVLGLRVYAEVGVLVAVSAAILWLSWTLLHWCEGRATRWVTLGYVLLAASLILPLASRLRPSDPASGARRPVQIWSGVSEGGARIVFDVASLPVVDHGSSTRWSGSLAERSAQWLLAALVAASILGILRLGLGWWRLRGFLAGLTPMRSLGHVHVCVSDETSAPFSASVGREAYVVLPVSLMGDPGRQRLTVLHELAHIRRGDTVGAYLLELVRALLPWHPAALIWARMMSQLQEIACDQALLARGVALREYADCLLQFALGSAARPRLRAAVGMGLGSRRSLRRRIQMLAEPSRRNSRWIVPAAAAVGLSLVGLVGSVATGAVADRRPSAADLRTIATSLAQRGGFEILVDETVVEQMGLMIGSEAQRALWSAALERGAEARKTIEPILQEHGVPIELAAVAMVESGFRNLHPGPAGSARRGAGMWQLIPETARHFDLTVDGSRDERMDVAKATHAAARYLKELHQTFDSWPLAIAAYTHGEGKVKEVVAAAGADDAAVLVKSGALSGYSSQVLAAMLLTERPDLVR